jgi:hypothetical protein
MSEFASGLGEFGMITILPTPDLHNNAITRQVEEIGQRILGLFEIALVLVRFSDVARVSVNENHYIM